MRSLIILILFFANLNVFSQDRSQWRGNSSYSNFQMQNWSVKGKITDSESNQGLSFATISIFTVDSILVSGGISDENGKFKIEIDPRKMMEKIRENRVVNQSSRRIGMALSAEIKYLGYETLKVKLPFTQENREIDLKNISLTPDATNLNEVTVRAERSSLELKLDKRVFNVGKDLSNKGGTAEEILENIPSIDLDIEGNISLRGSQSVRILIDGKPASMMGFDGPNAFKQLQGNEIDKVEIITNPSSRYSAEGSAGILNIILKKDRLKGLNGSVNINTGFPTQNGVSTSLNYRKDKFSINASVNASQRESKGGGFTNSDFFLSDTTYSSRVARESVNNSLSFGGRLGFSFFPNKNNIFSLSFGTRNSSRDGDNNNNYIDYNSIGTQIGTSNRTENSTRDSDNYNYNLSYTKNFSKRGHNLKLNFSWSDNVNDNEGTYMQTLPRTNRTVEQRTKEDGDRYDQNIRVDYTYPFNENKGKLEIGYKRDYDKMNSNYLAEQLFNNGTSSEEWRKIPPSNSYVYFQDVNALYFQIGNQSGKLSYQLGLRFEDTNFFAELTETNEITELKYSNFFPTAFLTYEFSDKESIQLSYSNRLRRPRFWDLNPFYGLGDSRSTYTGNPFLEPEITDSYEIGFLKEFKSGNFYVGTYYRYTTDNIERILDVNDNGYSVFKPINLGFTNAYGVELNGSIDYNKWLRTTGSFNFFQSETEGDYNEQNFYAKSYSWRTRLNNNIKMFNEKLEGQITFDYRGPSESTQGKNLSSYGLDLGLSKDIFKNKKGTISFTARDITKSRKRRYERGGREGDNFFTVGEYAWRRNQEFRISFQYRINQQKRRSQGRGNFDSSEFEGGDAIFGN